MKLILDDLIAAYKTFLTEQYPDHIKKYQASEENNADGAKFEAACYWILRSRGLDIQIGDTTSRGGADFLCSGASCRFVVEATTINTWAMERKAGIKHDPTGVPAGWYNAFPTLYDKLNDKVRQVQRYDYPTMVAIGSFHGESSTLFRNVIADEYLAVFFNSDGIFKVRPEDTLKDISAFALVAFDHNGYSTNAYLNPAPRHHFGIQFLPDIWFRQITQQGLIDGTLSGEWLSTNTKDLQTFEYPFEITKDCPTWRYE